MRAERNRCVDLLRVGAIAAVVLGHWLLVDVTYRGGALSGQDALEQIGWGRWLTLLLQVMPVFFLIGGYADAVSWTAHRAGGEPWWSWVRGRTARLAWPTAVYLAVCASAAVVARAAGVEPKVLALAGWLVALHLWFLPVYLLLIVLTPALHTAHRRWGAAVPMAMALGAVGVDALVLGPRLPVIGFANYLLVWGTTHQWGFAWQDGTLTTPRWRCRALAAAGVVLLCALVGWGPFPVDMIGAGTRVGNTAPPSVALLAFAAAQTGLVLMAEPALRRLLGRPRLWARVSRLNGAVMTVYLWHMIPVLVVAALFYPTGLAPQPAIGSAPWLGLRLPWLLLLSALLVPLTLAVVRAERPLGRIPEGLGVLGWWSPVLLLCALGALAPALAALAIGGFAAGGHLGVPPLARYGLGLLALLYAGPGRPARPPPPDGGPLTGPGPAGRTTPKVPGGGRLTARGAGSSAPGAGNGRRAVRPEPWARGAARERSRHRAARVCPVVVRAPRPSTGSRRWPGRVVPR
ncbi:acyltransferase [Streptomyces sp. NPDC057638]|uniref:acyltransferase family protein n=1 Tax=Streptomyces sp. NPDC057638 TaxID=3346190 RepID=UPI0036B63F39